MEIYQKISNIGRKKCYQNNKTLSQFNQNSKKKGEGIKGRGWMQMSGKVTGVQSTNIDGGWQNIYTFLFIWGLQNQNATIYTNNHADKIIQSFRMYKTQNIALKINRK